MCADRTYICCTAYTCSTSWACYPVFKERPAFVTLLRPAFAACFVAASSTSSTTGSATSFLLPGVFFSALLPTLFPGRRRQLLHPLPEVRQGLVLVRSGEPVEERPCIRSRFTGSGASFFLSFPRRRQEADQVINHLFSCGPTVLQFNPDFVLPNDSPTTELPARQSRP